MSVSTYQFLERSPGVKSDGDNGKIVLFMQVCHSLILVGDGRSFDRLYFIRRKTVHSIITGEL